MNTAKKKIICRLCNGYHLVKSINLGKSPLANEFSDKPIKNKTYPLAVLRCESCNHLQLSHVIDKKMLFSKYLFVSGTSMTNLNHFKKYAEECSRRFIKKKSKILDIASNDGSFLKFFDNSNIRVGIDPAKNISPKIKLDNYFIVNKFFNYSESQKLKNKYGQFDLITANNVCAHVDDLSNFVRGVRNLLKINGVFIFEVGYFHEVYKNKTFDTIYHEHLDYHLFIPLINFFSIHDMEIFDVKSIFIQGGSIRVYVSHKGKKEINKFNIEKFIKREKKINYSNKNVFLKYQEFIDKKKDQLLKKVKFLKNKKYKIAGYGASAKSTTFLNYFCINYKHLDFIVDVSKLKQFRYSPGSNLQILPVNEIYKRKIHYIIILSWNFSKEIINQNIQFIKKGGKFIIAFPKIIIVNSKNYKKILKSF